jgi:hypothetical protein
VVQLILETYPPDEGYKFVYVVNGNDDVDDHHSTTTSINITIKRMQCVDSTIQPQHNSGVTVTHSPMSMMHHHRSLPLVWLVWF